MWESSTSYVEENVRYNTQKIRTPIEYRRSGGTVDAAVMEKYIMFCDIDSNFILLGASFIVGSTPTFSVCERGSSDGRARKRKPNHVS